MRKYYILVSILMTGTLFFSPGCGSKDAESKTKQQQQIPVHEQKLQSYFSESKAGKWSDLDDKHTPIVTISKSKKEITITATAPFPSRPDHYVETILLADYSLKEMNKENFTRINPKTVKAIFNLPVFSKGEFYVLLKCNLHDTWYKKILIH